MRFYNSKIYVFNSGTQIFWLHVIAATCRISLIQCRPLHVNVPTGMEIIMHKILVGKYYLFSSKLFR